MSLVHRVVLAGLCLLAALLAAGCARPGLLLGTNDVELTYEVDAETSPTPFGEDVRARVVRRLTSAHVGADVVEDGRFVRITTDEALAPLVDELVSWSGALQAYDPDPEYDLAPIRAEGLSPKAVAHEGRLERWFEGSHLDVLRAVRTWTTDSAHRLVAEPVWSSSQDPHAVTWRTRVVRAKPAAELGDGVVVAWGEGGTLRLRAAAGRADAALETIRAGATGNVARQVVVRGHTSLGFARIAGGGLVLVFGDGPPAYARAQEERHILTTAGLPPLKPESAVGLPPDRLLSASCFVLPVVLSVCWLVFVRRFDRAHPEPAWLVTVTFLLGAAATIPAGLLELLFVQASPWLDPRLVTFGGQLFALPLAVVVFTVVIGVCEEGMKMAAAAYAARRPEFDEPVDGIVYGIVASLGFAAAENVRYFTVVRLAVPAVLARTFMSVPAHMFFGAIWGFALGAYLVDKNRRRIVVYGLAAAAAHGSFDALLAIEGVSLFAVALNVVLASVFVILVRRALRYGVLTDPFAKIPPHGRLLVRVGRPVAFWLATLAFHSSAAAIFVLGAWYQLARHRPTLTFSLGSSLLLSLLAVAAYAVSATIPLDVAIDDHGVTFAGALRPWARIRGFAVEVDLVRLDCEGGPIVLGPGSPSAIDRIAKALAPRLGAVRAVTLESHRS